VRVASRCGLGDMGQSWHGRHPRRLRPWGNPNLSPGGEPCRSGASPAGGAVPNHPVPCRAGPSGPGREPGSRRLSGGCGDAPQLWGCPPVPAPSQRGRPHRGAWLTAGLVEMKMRSVIRGTEAAGATPGAPRTCQAVGGGDRVVAILGCFGGLRRALVHRHPVFRWQGLSRGRGSRAAGAKPLPRPLSGCRGDVTQSRRGDLGGGTVPAPGREVLIHRAESRLGKVMPPWPRPRDAPVRPALPASLRPSGQSGDPRGAGAGGGTALATGLFGRRRCGRARFEGSASTRARNARWRLPRAPLWLPSAQTPPPPPPPPPPPRMLVAPLFFGEAGTWRAAETRHNSSHAARLQFLRCRGGGPRIWASPGGVLCCGTGGRARRRQQHRATARGAAGIALACSCTRLHALACFLACARVHSRVLHRMCILPHVLHRMCILPHVLHRMCMLPHALTRFHTSSLACACSGTLLHVLAHTCVLLHAPSWPCTRSGTRGSQLPSRDPACTAAIRVQRGNPALPASPDKALPRDGGSRGAGCHGLRGTWGVWGCLGFHVAVGSQSSGVLAVGCWLWGAPAWLPAPLRGPSTLLPAADSCWEAFLDTGHVLSASQMSPGAGGLPGGGWPPRRQLSPAFCHGCRRSPSTAQVSGWVRAAPASPGDTQGWGDAPGDPSRDAGWAGRTRVGKHRRKQPSARLSAGVSASPPSVWHPGAPQHLGGGEDKSL